MGLYEKVKPLVHSFKISGTFYREAGESEYLEHLQPGDTIDYRSCLTRWVERIDEDESIILKRARTPIDGRSHPRRVT